MIGKVPRPGKGFKGLVRYLLHGDRKKPHDPDRVAWCEFRNLLVDDPEKVPAVMRATAAFSKRVKKPVYHYVISWHRDEAPSDDLMRQVADTTCEDLGLSDYQALYIGHDDTDHRHVHIVVNRVHPETRRAWRTSNDYRRIEKSLRRQSEEMGRDYVPGRHNDPERFYAQAPRRRLRSGGYHRSRRLGERMRPNTLSNEMQAAFMAIYRGASSWSQLDDALTALGLRLEAKGQGAVLIGDGAEHKLSAFGKNVRLKQLQERFGEGLTDFRRRESVETESLEPNLRAAHTRAELAKLLHGQQLIDDSELQRQQEHHEKSADAAAWPLAALSKDEEGYGAYLSYAEAAASADFAYCLHRIGLVDESQLAKAVAEREAAEDALANYQAAVDQLVVDATKTLFGSSEERTDASGKRLTKPRKTRINDLDDEHGFEPER
ncbi:Relaxase/mobilization nuclease domain protein [Methyloligella halotolerans]|uniref:Relaxase/mobilization nuclease domain protein n=1 Tax=Methyloligella halotolerans TaxID=1177755 RepID=A0A1E2RV07_9HYPH|nr:relaxase/mobilization nuclease domain-containing protein [Methyloligella halotolerans]ODA66041.1 Relaxase/mobilization nuclease domain protein [Methyloligella halotolerans]